jgi:hypothetical protein
MSTKRKRQDFLKGSQSKKIFEGVVQDGLCLLSSSSSSSSSPSSTLSSTSLNETKQVKIVEKTKQVRSKQASIQSFMSQFAGDGYLEEKLSVKESLETPNIPGLSLISNYITAEVRSAPTTAISQCLLSNVCPFDRSTRNV